MKWKPDAVHNRASKFANNGKVLVRIQYYQNRLEGLHAIAMNDPAERYEPSGMIKNIHDIPPHIRKTLTGIKHKVVMRNSINEDGI